jgi:hypothetical protein
LIDFPLFPNQLPVGGQRAGEARPYFAKATDELGKEEWLVENETGRLAMLRE